MQELIQAIAEEQEMLTQTAEFLVLHMQKLDGQGGKKAVSHENQSKRSSTIRWDGD